MTKKELNHYYEFSQNIAREAGKLLLEKSRRRNRIHYKGRVDLVTEADVASERFIVDSVKKEFPQHSILAEEEAARKKAEEDRKKREAERYKALVDGELETVESARNATVALIKQQQYRQAFDKLTTEQRKLETPEGKAAIQVFVDLCTRLEGLLKFLAARAMNSLFPPL